MSVQDVDCCGCSACFLVCPNSAITMAFDESGSYSAHIDEEKCIECQLCRKVCSSINDDAPRINEEKVFTSVSRDRSVLERSSSGGIGYVFAKNAIEKGMIVCGVTYDCREECARHIVINNTDELYKIQGSKYLQSINAESFDELINSKKKCMVFGTPCQIAGLDRVTKEKGIRERFIMVDIFCHGTPNQLLWKNHLSYLRRKKKISEFDSVIFRQMKNFRICIGKYTAWYNQDAFYTFFLRGWMKNHKCYDCGYRRNSLSDIRIGDCMVDKYAELSFSPSTVITNTLAGEVFLNECQEELELYKEPFATVDGIQERENMVIPEPYTSMLSQLQKGTAPEDLIKRTMVKGRVKAVVKQIIRVLKRKSSDDLESIIRRQ